MASVDCVELSRFANDVAIFDCKAPLLGYVHRHVTVPYKSSSYYYQGRVATGWTGVDMSTPLLPEVVPEIDANPVSFYSGGVGESVMVWSFRTLSSK